MRSNSLLLSKVDENLIKTWYVKETDLRWNIIAIESNFQSHWVFYIRYPICDVSNAYTQIGLISDTGDPYIQLVMTAEVPEPTHTVGYLEALGLWYICKSPLNLGHHQCHMVDCQTVCSRLELGLTGRKASNADSKPFPYVTCHVTWAANLRGTGSLYHECMPIGTFPIDQSACLALAFPSWPFNMSVLGQTAGIERMEKAGRQASMMRTAVVGGDQRIPLLWHHPEFEERTYSSSYDKRSVWESQCLYTPFESSVKVRVVENNETQMGWQKYMSMELAKSPTYFEGFVAYK